MAYVFQNGSCAQFPYFFYQYLMLSDFLISWKKIISHDNLIGILFISVQLNSSSYTHEISQFLILWTVFL